MFTEIAIQAYMHQHKQEDIHILSGILTYVLV